MATAWIPVIGQLIGLAQFAAERIAARRDRKRAAAKPSEPTQPNTPAAKAKR